MSNITYNILPRYDKVKYRAKAYYRYNHSEKNKIKSCEICKSKKHMHAHHEDYAEPTKVIYLCALCHSKRHHYKKEFIDDEITKTVFASHGFDIVEIIKDQIENNISKYKLYYREYFERDSFKRKIYDHKSKKWITTY